MATAAYTSVLNLLRVIDNIQLPSRLRLFPDATQIDSLREKLSFLQDFFELHSSTITKDVERVARGIPRVTNAAESIIDSYVVDQLYKESDDPQNDVSGWNIESFPKEIRRVIQEIESINDELTTLMTIQHDQDGEKPLNFDHPKTISREETTMVGFDDQLEQVMKKFTVNRKDFEVVPIVGMGGIGKTTLARSVFDHPYNLHRFDERIWLTISQDYSVKNILQGLLKDSESDEKKLIEQLHQKLLGKRYLIVLDDVWSADAWDYLKWGFPKNKNGSRVMVTTRLSDIASSLDSKNDNTYSVKFLDEEKSWDLFSAKAFEKGGRSRELEKIGREISKRCRGLPLMLVVIAGLLANSNMTVEYWQAVAKDINSFASSAYDEYCSRTLLLSYRHLPIHLKPCFLYMRHFREDSDIKVSELIKRWVSEGFVKPMNRRSLEEAARKYFDVLIARNMFLIRKRGIKGKIKTCGIHDLLRDLCIKESKKEQLWEISRIVSVFGNGSYYAYDCIFCHAYNFNSKVLCFQILGSESTTNDHRVSICSSCEIAFPEFTRTRFVAAIKVDNRTSPVMTKYRCLHVLARHFLVFNTTTTRLLWNLEAIDNSYLLDVRMVAIPKDIWEMPQLRHVNVGIFKMPNPVVETRNDVIVLDKLQTLRTIAQFKCTEEIVRRIPNVRKLGLRYDPEEEADWPNFCLQNLACLQKLESLSINCKYIVSMDFKQDIAFPCSLKELTLEYCGIAWEDVTIIGSSLPNLQVLKLVYEVEGNEWNPIDEGELFVRLKYLELCRLELVHWRVDHETHFPALETLVLKRMYYLKEIPREIGELPSLNSIYLELCSERIIDSARDIVEEQTSNGNEGQFVVHIKRINDRLVPLII